MYTRMYTVLLIPPPPSKNNNNKKHTHTHTHTHMYAHTVNIVSAVAGLDYIVTSDSSLEFHVGAANGDMSRCLSVMVTNDEIIEGDETFTVTLTVNTAGVMEGNNETTVIILTSTDDCEYLLATRDNDATCMLVKFVVLALRGTELEISVDEGDGVAEVCIELAFLPDPSFPTETNLLINVSTQEGKTTIISIAICHVSLVHRFCNCWL